MCSMLLGYNFEPRQNNQQFGKAGLSYNHWFIKTRQDKIYFTQLHLHVTDWKKREKYKYIYISKE